MIQFFSTVIYPDTEQSRMKSLLAGLAAGILVLLVCLCGCTTPPVQPPATTPPTTAAPATQVQTPVPATLPAQDTLSGITWYLIAFNQAGTSKSVLPGTAITAFFDNQGMVTGSAGCNQYSAAYQATLTSLSIKAPASTKMSCSDPPGTMAQETTYLTTIQGASSYTIANGILTIRDSNGRDLLTYGKTPPGVTTPAPLTNTTWYLTSFVDSAGKIWTPVPGASISLLFSTDGKLGGNGGCNQYSGSYTLSGNTLAISPTFARTLMYCGTSGVMALEDTYLTVLPQMTVYRISGNQLTLSDGTGKVTMLYTINPL
jgi:heat shock protein HslJ